MKSFQEHLEIDDLYLDKEDRARLEALPEIECEKILNKRFRDLKEIEEKKQMVKMEQSRLPAVKPDIPKFEDCQFLALREMLTRNVFKPFFPIFKGCFIRVKLGNQYCICKIIGIKEGESYEIKCGDKCLRTCVYLTIDAGNRICKNFQLTNVSSKGAQREEFEEFIKDFNISNLESLNEKYKKVAAEMERDLTNDEITRMILNKQKANPKKMSSTDMKIDLILRRDAAVAAKNKEEAFKFQRMLEELEDSEKNKKLKKEEEEMEEIRKRLKDH